jgi:hypothetical protein
MKLIILILALTISLSMRTKKLKCEGNAFNYLKRTTYIKNRIVDSQQNYQDGYQDLLKFTFSHYGYLSETDNTLNIGRYISYKNIQNVDLYIGDNKDANLIIEFVETNVTYKRDYHIDYEDPFGSCARILIHWLDMRKAGIRR